MLDVGSSEREIVGKMRLILVVVDDVFYTIAILYILFCNYIAAASRRIHWVGMG